MSSQSPSQRRRSRLPSSGSKAAGPAGPAGPAAAAPAGYEVPEGIEANNTYAVPEQVELAVNKEQLVESLVDMMKNLKKKTPSPPPPPPISSSWNSSATPSSSPSPSPESRLVSGFPDGPEPNAAPGLVNKRIAKFENLPPEPAGQAAPAAPAAAAAAKPPTPAKRPSKKKAPPSATQRPSSPKTRKKPSPSSAGPTRKFDSNKIKSKFDKTKKKGALPKSRRQPLASPRPNKTKKKSASSSPKPAIPPRAPVRKPRLARKQSPKNHNYENVKKVHNPKKPRKENFYENLGSVADKIRAQESIYENVGKIMRAKFDEAQIDASKPMPSFKKKAAGPDYVYDDPFQSQKTLTSAVAANTARVVQSKNHLVYRISGDGLCSINSLFTIMGFSRLRIVSPPDAKSSKTYIASHSISPVYLIDFFRELSLITVPSCIPKIELIAQFLGFQCNNYQLKYQEKFMEKLNNIIIRKKINPRFKSYLQNLQLFIGVSLMHKTSEQRNKFISDNNLKPIYDAMDGDSFLGEIIKEYFIKVKLGSEISSLTVTDTDIPQANRYRGIGINEPFIEINDMAQIELPVNPFVLTQIPGNLTKDKENEIKQNTVYFLHSGRRSASGTASSTSGHWDIVVPAVIHDFIKTRTQGYTKKHEKWIQAFVDSHHEIIDDITSPRKGNHWMWYVFPSEIPGQSDRKKIDMDSDSYDELFHSRSFYIGFLSTWCDILKQIAEKMESDTTKDKNKWLHDERDRRRVGHCYSKYEEWFLTKFKPRNTKNIFAIKARFYLAYIYKCVIEGSNAGAISIPG